MPGVQGLSIADYTAATGDSPTSSRIKRGLERRGFFSSFCHWVDNNIIKPVVKAVVAVVKAVVEVIKVVVKTAEEIAEDAVALIQKAAAALLPQFHPSISFTLPVDISIPDWMLDDSPWGDAYKIYSWTMDSSDINYGISADSLAKLTGADALLPDLSLEDIGLQTPPEPSVDIYCVGCEITGSLQTRGTATYTLLVGFTDLVISFNGDVHAQFQVGVNAFVTKTWSTPEVRIIELGVPGFFIPDVITVGPMLTLGLDAEIKIDALGQILAGASYDFNHIGANIDFFNPKQSSSHGTTPVVSTIFEAYGEVNTTVSLGMPMGIGVGIDVLDGAWSKEVALINRPAIEAVYQFSYYESENETCVETNSGTGATNCITSAEVVENNGTCDGVNFYMDFANEVSLDLLGSKYDVGTWNSPHLVDACIGVVPKGSTATPTSSLGPIVTGGSSGSGGGDTSSHGCPLVDNAVANSGFESGTDGWSLQDYQSTGVQWGVSADGATTSPPNSAYLILPNGQDGVYSLSHSVTLCTDTSYDVFYQVRYASGDKVAYTRAVEIGDEEVYGNSDSLYVVTAGKDYMQQKGPVSAH